MSDTIKLAGVDVASERVFSFRMDNESYRVARAVNGQILAEKEGETVDPNDLSEEILQYIRPTISEKAQSFINELDKLDRRKIYETISKLCLTPGVSVTYGGNYAIECTHNGLDTVIDRILPVERGHVAVYNTGDGVDILGVYRNPHDADKLIQTFKARRNKRMELRGAVRGFDNDYEQLNPRPEPEDFPERPEYEPGMATDYFIKTFMKPWREQVNKIAQRNMRQGDEWSAALFAARQKWIKKNLSNVMKEFRISEGELVMSNSVLVGEASYFVANAPMIG